MGNVNHKIVDIGGISRIIALLSPFSLTSSAGLAKRLKPNSTKGGKTRSIKDRLNFANFSHVANDNNPGCETLNPFPGTKINLGSLTELSNKLRRQEQESYKIH